MILHPRCRWPRLLCSKSIRVASTSTSRSPSVQVLVVGLQAARGQVKAHFGSSFGERSVPIVHEDQVTPSFGFERWSRPRRDGCPNDRRCSGRPWKVRTPGFSGGDAGPLRDILEAKVPRFLYKDSRSGCGASDIRGTIAIHVTNGARHRCGTGTVGEEVHLRRLARRSFTGSRPVRVASSMRMSGPLAPGALASPLFVHGRMPA